MEHLVNGTVVSFTKPLELHHELAQQSPERIQALCDDELNQDSDNPSIGPKVDSQIEP